MSDNNNEDNSNEATTRSSQIIRVLKFVPFATSVESSFWVKYMHEKLERIQLDEQPVDIQLSYSFLGGSTNSSNNTPIRLLQCQEHSLLIPVRQQDDGNDDSQNRVRTNNNNKQNNECIVSSGSLIGYNTAEAFQKVDKNVLLRNYFLSQFLDASDDDDQTVLQALNCNLLVIYADLKQHKIIYWFGIPAMVPVCIKKGGGGSSSSSSIYATTSVVQTVVDNDDDNPSKLLYPKLPQLIDNMRQRSILFDDSTTSTSMGGLIPYFLYVPTKNICQPLSRQAFFAMMQERDGATPTAVEDIVFGFFDPVTTTTTTTTTASTTNNNDDTSLTMGWPLRNLVAYMSFHLQLGGQTVQILSYRPKVIRRINTTTTVNNSQEHSTSSSSSIDNAVLVDDHDDPMTDNEEKSNDDNDDPPVMIQFTIRVPAKEEYEQPADNKAKKDGQEEEDVDPYAKYKVVGWELNARSKPGPRSVNLQPLLDPTHLAIQAADLNLKLMKWRMIPSLDVPRLQSSKVLLIGAGTLGCNVARVLLGWGIRHFTIVDYGHVSYSNPVRQSLFTLDDCHSSVGSKKDGGEGGGGSGRLKAAAAAQALQTIAPDVHSTGIMLSIPMPGHPEKEELIRESVETLDGLIQEADAVFLLTDTRESRWLPTVMAAAHDKLLINAALGLDSWLVMRHGGSPHQNKNDNNAASGSSSSSIQRHGCYFCSDVVAPENSTKNRTLDQQCTVTRPGLTMIASAMAVEMMVSILHHPDHIQAPAPAVGTSRHFSPTVSNKNDDNVTASPLGVIPHQIRGSLVSYTMMTPTVPAFLHCTACSGNVVDAYRKDKMDLVVQSSSQTGSYLEDVSGLTAYRAAEAEKLVDMEGWEDDE